MKRHGFAVWQGGIRDGKGAISAERLSFACPIHANSTVVAMAITIKVNAAHTVDVDPVNSGQESQNHSN
jgi:hypothetical protein